MTENNYCILKPDKKAVTISLKLEDGLRAGADFKLFDTENKRELEHFKLSTEDSKAAVYKITTPFVRLNKVKLAFGILVCTKTPNLFKGNVEILIFQNELVAKLTKPLVYKMQNIPPCSFNNAEKIIGSVFFVINSDDPKKPFTI